MAACFGFAIYTAGIVVYGFTAFFDPIIQEFGWSYAQISLAASLRGAESGLIAPVLGFFIDRWGARWVLFIGGLVTGLGLIFLSMIDTLTGFYLAFFIIAVGTSCCGPSVITPAASNWFRRNLGMAIGILSAGFAFGGTLVPLVIWMIDTFQWRLTLLILGIAGLVVCLPLSLVIRDRPEKYGYAQDGGPLPEEPREESASLPSTTPPAEVDIGVKPALKSRTFWHLSLAFTLQYVVIGGILTHIIPYLESVDVPRSTASFFAGAIPVVSIAGRLSSGWLSDKFNRKNVTAAYFGVICIGTLLFDYVSGLTIWVLYWLSFSTASYGSIIPCVRSPQRILWPVAPPPSSAFSPAYYPWAPYWDRFWRAGFLIPLPAITMPGGYSPSSISWPYCSWSPRRR